VTPKNHERRDVTIDGRTAATLQAWRKAQAAERLAWGGAYRDTEGVVFTWRTAGRCCRTTSPRPSAR
jgi:hypothetical protein